MKEVTMQTKMQCGLYFTFLTMTYRLLSSGEECPCIIDSTTETADCSGMSLQAVPGCVPRSVKKLLLKKSFFKKVYPKQFEKYSELLYLDLNNSAIAYLSDAAFIGLPVLETLRLSGNVLFVLNTTAFIGLPKLQLLDLSDNRIVEIKENIFSRLSNLRQLYLTYNNIEILNTRTFVGLSSLKRLELGDNPLCFETSFPLDIFQPLIKLEYLDIRMRQGRDTCLYIDQQLKWLTSLKILVTDYCPANSFGKGFTFLSNLEELIIEHCHLYEISEKTFVNLKNSTLRKLTLCHTYVTIVHPSTFTSLKYLDSLDLSGNTDLCNMGFYNLSVGLNLTNIRFLTLASICNRKWNLASNNMVDLRRTRLESLSLAFSLVYVIYPSAFEKLPRSLKSLDLSGNKMQTLDLSCLYILENLQYLDISDSLLIGNYRNLKQMFKRRLSYSETKIAAAKKQMSEIVFPQHHKNLFDSGVSSITQFDVYESNKQRLIQPSHNRHITKRAACFTPPYKLETVNLSNSYYLSSVTSILCSANNSLKVIDASYAGQTSQSANSLQELWKQMKNLQELESLNLSANHIKKLPINVFSEQKHLKEVSLSRNFIVDVNFDIQMLFGLESVDLSENRIAYIPSQFTQHIETISKHSNITVYLHGNRLACKCEQLDFVTWLLNTRVVFRKDNLTCEFKNGTEIALVRISDIHTQLEAECFFWHVLLSSIVGFVTLIVALSFGAFIYHKRWRFKYLSLIARRNINPFHAIEDREILLEYDLYISYDRDHVVNSYGTLHELMTQRIYPSLKQRGLNVLIREELDIGRKLFDVITHALRRSRKVVCLLSSEYCSDHWNLFEFNMAVMEGIYTKREVVIPIILETPNPKDLYEEVYTFLRSVPVARFTFDRNVRALIDFLTESAR